MTLLPPHHPYAEKVKRVGERLYAANYKKMSELMGDVKWKCYIVDDKSVINASVLPVR